MERRLPGLDGLRAFAVGLVLLFHQYLLPVGWVGVQIFFVLSGFLITRLLYRDVETPLGDYLRAFYGRRALRIFPLYYLVLAVLGVALLYQPRLPGVREGFPYAISYTYNFWYGTHATEFSPFITHFWTLCVEEQFYLVWPLLIYFCPKRLLRAMLALLVLFGPVFRAAMANYLETPGATQLWDPYVALDVLTPTHVDAFAIGAYAALFPLGGSRRALLAVVSLLAAMGVLLIRHAHLPWASFGYPIGLRSCYAYVWAYSLISIASALLIDCLAHRKLLPALFESAPLSYLGKISYGIYLVHYPVQGGIARLLPMASIMPRLGLQVALSIPLAAGLHHLLETPCFRLKERWFPGPLAKVTG